MVKLWMLLGFVFIVCFKIHPIFLKNVPIECEQPDGEKLILYFTGDKEARLLHDNDMNLVVKINNTMQYSYITSNNKLVPVTKRASTTKKTLFKKYYEELDIEKEKKYRINQGYIEIPSETIIKGDYIHNLIVFIRFPTNSLESLYSKKFTKKTYQQRYP